MCHFRRVCGADCLNEYVKFRDSCLNYSREIPPIPVKGGIFDSFFHYNFRPEVGNDVISGVTVYYVGVDVRVKFGDSRSNVYRDIRWADFVSNERTNTSKPIT